MVEQNMEADFQSVSQMPPLGHRHASSPKCRRCPRGGAPGLDRLGLCSSTLATLRLTPGPRNCLARARAALLLCQGDQLSIDRGSWVVSGELALEDPPPMAAFSSHTLPTEAEPQHSKLIDARWMELVLHRLNEIDQLTEKKRKLSKKPADPKGDPKGKGKGKKGDGKSASQTEAESNN